MTFSLLGTIKEGVQAHNLLPLYILLAKPLSDTVVAGEQHSAVYRLSRACRLTSFVEFDGRRQAEANLILPEINKLSLDVKAGKLTILLVSCGETKNSLCEAIIGGCCSWGKIPMESLYMSLERCVSMTFGHRAEMMSNVDMQSCFMKPCLLEEGSCVTFQIPWNSGTTGSSQQVQVNIAAQEVGAKKRSAYNSYRHSDVSTSSFSNIVQLRAGNVIFNYRDLNNMLRKTEVTEDFSCPFCFMQCASFKGLRYHLCSSHDLFNFDYWVTEEYQAVNISVKIDILRSQTAADEVDPQLQTFFFCSKKRKRRRSMNPGQNAKHVYPHFLDSSAANLTREGTCNGFLDEHDGEKAHKSLSNFKDFQNGKHGTENCDSDSIRPTDCIERVESSFNNVTLPIAIAHSVDPECVLSVSGLDRTPPATLLCAKTRKLSFERSDSRNRLLLQKRQFFHSHRAQPMALDQVVSDRDSEDEVDDDIADLEDRRMLDDFVDVSKDEKHLMHLWNSFIRKQRVLADGHIPWACEAFSKLHGRELIRAPDLFWCWRLFMIKLWNHGLLDPRTMDGCNLILENYRIGGPDPMES